MKLSAFSRSLVLAFAWLAFGLTAALAQATLPAGQVGVAYSPPSGYQVTTTPAAPAGTAYAATGLPPGLSINASSGVISGNPTTAGVYTGSVSLTSNGVTNSFTYTLNVAGAAGTPAINSSLSIAATAGTAIATYNLTATPAATSFNVGALPTGLTLNTTAPASLAAPTITGTPTTPGTYTVSLSANNGSGTGTVATLTITVAAASGAPVITSATTYAAGSLNVPLSTGPNPGNYSIATNVAATSFSATGLPVGLSLNTTSGVISGTPTVGGIYSVTLSASNGSGAGPNSTLTMTLGSLPAITSAAAASGNVGTAFSFTVTASNSPGGFTITGLPPGLSANTTTGVISGTPTTVGSSTVNLSATNVVGTGPAATLAINIAAALPPPGGGGIPGVAPTITSSPVALTVAVGDSASFQVTATGTVTLTYQWRKNGTAIVGATSSTYVISNAQASDVASYDVVVSNAVGSATSAAAALSLTGLLTPPVIVTQPANQTVVAGATASFAVAVTGNPAPTYQWRKNGNAITGATAATLTLSNAAASDIATYTVVVTNSQGTVTSSSASLAVTTPPVALPVISAQPVAQTATVGGSVTFSAAATGTGLTYQWRKDGAPITGATNATFTLPNVQASDSGSYSVAITNATGTVTSAAAALTVPVLVSRLANVSVRSGAGTGDQTLIVGLSVGGTGVKNALLRGVGPGLTQFGVSGALADPVLRLFNAAGAQTNINDDWGGGAALSAAFSLVGAFSLPAASKDAVLSVPLAAGSYTAQITAASGTGVALLEAYDSDSAASTARLVNISARTQVGTGENILVIGFVVTGSSSKRVLLRGVGPGLTQFGVGGVLADPQLRLFNAAGAQTDLNNDWGGTAALNTAFGQTGAFGLPAASKDAALIVTLPPGAYTAQVSGAADTTGVALVEVYELP